MSNAVFTIGHSTHAVEEFVRLLARHGVTRIADVRSSPYSRQNPQFNRETIALALGRAGITYVFLGAELGARSKDRACYVNGKVRYDLLAGTALFQRGLERITQDSREHVVAIMCAEKDPLECHRTILISRRLAERGVEVRHILADGGLETHDAAVARLLAELDLPDHDLFRSREEIVEEAYRKRGEAIAYADDAQTDGAGLS